jgi:hypothetical protein
MFCIFNNFQKSVSKKENENRDNFLQKIRIYTLFQKTHPKFKEFLNVLYLEGFFKKGK